MQLHIFHSVLFADLDVSGMVNKACFFTYSLVSEMEETILSALRPSQKMADRVISPSGSSRLPVDPSELPPDRLHVELELSPDSQITLYGPLLKAFLSVKVYRTRWVDRLTEFLVLLGHVKLCFHPLMDEMSLFTMGRKKVWNGIVLIWNSYFRR